MEANQPTKPCSCFIRHALTQKERVKVMDDLTYFRNIGDTRGATLALAALTKCPGQR